VAGPVQRLAPARTAPGEHKQARPRSEGDSVKSPGMAYTDGDKRELQHQNAVEPTRHTSKPRAR
jgi:hypothetical protein